MCASQAHVVLAATTSGHGTDATPRRRSKRPAVSGRRVGTWRRSRSGRLRRLAGSDVDPGACCTAERNCQSAADTARSADVLDRPHAALVGLDGER